MDKGTVVMDAATGRVGQVMGREGLYVLLRPVGGGKEWEARPENVRVATAAERLSARVAEANVNAARGWGR